MRRFFVGLANRYPLSPVLFPRFLELPPVSLPPAPTPELQKWKEDAEKSLKRERLAFFKEQQLLSLQLLRTILGVFAIVFGIERYFKLKQKILTDSDSFIEHFLNMTKDIWDGSQVTKVRKTKLQKSHLISSKKYFQTLIFLWNVA